MKRLNNAFTLTELLVALGVIAILCAILLPIIFNAMPNQNTVMAKRAYYAMQTLVSDMINDEACYPDKTSSVSEKRIGFDDGRGYANCIKWGGSENTGTIENPGDTGTKFQTIFFDKLSAAKSGNGYNTTDGIYWEYQKVNGFATDATKYNKMKIDVSGLGSGTNSTSGSSPDTFYVRIYSDGKLTIENDWALKAVSVSKDITE